MSDDKPENRGSVAIRSYLLNKKERYESEIKAGRRDTRIDEIQILIDSINDSKTDMYERRKRIDGFDFIYAEGKIVGLLTEIFDNYILGNYYSTIATSSMVCRKTLLRFY